MTDDSLERASAMIQAGKIEAARNQLELIIKNDRSNIPAWELYARTWPKAADKARIWQACLRYNPANQQVQETLKKFNITPQEPVKPERRPQTVYKRRSSSNTSFWVLWGLIGLLIVAAIFAWGRVDKSTPIDPQKYRHVQPVEYYLYVPRDYSADREWPLFVGIHGSGGNGLHCWQLWQSYAEKDGFILLCPSIPGSAEGFYLDVGETTVWSAVAEVQKEYRVQQRMFLSGVSAGAYFVQGFALDYPQAVSGLSILSAGMYTDPGLFREFIPMLVVIGDQDNAAAVQASWTFAGLLQTYGFNVQYVVMPGVGHTVTQEGVDLTINLFRRTIGK